MANSYTQIHIQCVFAVKFRKAMIAEQWKHQLHKYISSIIQNHQHKMISINSMPDHLHMLFGMRPQQSLADLMRIVKGDSSEWINKKKFATSLFRWQDGYGGFSYQKSSISTVAAYIENQELHHKKISFADEYRQLLKEFEIEYDEQYIFRPLE
ncbi:MAG TPA: IS200/IS605 family transposase [Chitinophagaceae bacterium]|nr:IS200/IS605 family transposase [Chitinophagaceae bacterium]